jgi:hypothetical protein
MHHGNRPAPKKANQIGVGGVTETEARWWHIVGTDNQQALDGEDRGNSTGLLSSGLI